MKKILIILILLAGLAYACLPQLHLNSQPAVSSAGPVIDEAPIIPAPPDRDLFDLARRLRPGAGEIPGVVNPTQPEYPLGTRQTFWISDIQSSRHFTTTLTLRHETPHTYWYVQDGQEVALSDLQSSANEFENHIFPTITQYYGENWYLGIDNDPHLTIINARIPAVAGYFSASDQYPTQINPYSNERKAIYMNLGAVRPGTSSYNAVLAHEFQHALYWGVNPNSESWINEGAAELASEVTGYSSGFTNSFLSRPDTQLNTWPEESGASGPHYGASMLFLKYLAQQNGGYDELKEILSTPGRGTQAITNYLESKGNTGGFDAVFKDWIIANYLNQSGGRYGYTEEHKAAKGEPVKPGEHGAIVNQYAADYLELPLDSPDLNIDFLGSTQVSLIPGEAYSGRAQWWSNRGDSTNTTLTRKFDLQGLDTASLNFWTWYDIEQPWDYAYVEASLDGGETWSILPSSHTTRENPLGNSFGPGYTGVSGGGKEPAWIRDSVDLSAFAGYEVLIRFEYVTDEAVNQDGFALDDISIPELGFFDDVEQDGGWEAGGFFRTVNSLRQRFSLQIIKIGTDTIVEEVPVDDEGRASLELRGLGSVIKKAVLAVSALTPITTQPAPYRVNISQVEP